MLRLQSTRVWILLCCVCRQRMGFDKRVRMWPRARPTVKPTLTSGQTENRMKQKQDQYAQAQADRRTCACSEACGSARSTASKSPLAAADTRRTSSRNQGRGWLPLKHKGNLLHPACPWPSQFDHILDTSHVRVRTKTCSSCQVCLHLDTMAENFGRQQAELLGWIQQATSTGGSCGSCWNMTRVSSPVIQRSCKMVPKSLQNLPNANICKQSIRQENCSLCSVYPLRCWCLHRSP